MPDYTLANDDGERLRLARQAADLRPATERLFRAAGLQAGMRVLDVGCGAGDVAALAAELVGPTGSVLAIDRDERQVAACSTRWAALPNVTFAVGDLTKPPDGPFDAVVGRLVLMYQPDVGAALAALTSRLRAGGVAAFMETTLRTDASSAIQWPERGPVGRQVQEWVTTAFASSGVQPLMGLRLPGALRAAGFDVRPPYETVTMIHEGEEVVANTIELLTSMRPRLLAAGVPEADLALDTLAQRLRDEHGADVVLAVGPLVGAWGRLV